ncbi:MAG: J domain-containing protein [Chitinophagales bacterium]
MRFFKAVRDSLNELANGSDENIGGITAATRQARLIEMEQAIIALSAAAIKPGNMGTSAQEEVVLTFLQQQFGDKRQSVRRHSLQQHVQMGAQPLVKMACEVVKALADLPSRTMLMLLLTDLLATERWVNQRDIRWLEKVADYLSIEETQWQIVQERIRQCSPYALLGIDENAGIQKIKAAYRKMVLLYHPDKHPGGGALAEQRFRNIQRAYETVMRLQTGA